MSKLGAKLTQFFLNIGNTNDRIAHKLLPLSDIICHLNMLFLIVTLGNQERTECHFSKINPILYWVNQTPIYHTPISNAFFSNVLLMTSIMKEYLKKRAV